MVYESIVYIWSISIRDDKGVLNAGIIHFYTE